MLVVGGGDVISGRTYGYALLGVLVVCVLWWVFYSGCVMVGVLGWVCYCGYIMVDMLELGVLGWLVVDVIEWVCWDE